MNKNLSHRSVTMLGSLPNRFAGFFFLLASFISGTGNLSFVHYSRVHILMAGNLVKWRGKAQQGNTS